MARLQLLRSPFAKNAPANGPFLVQSPGGGTRGAATPVSRPARRGSNSPLLGVHVDGVLDLPIVQQPQGDDCYVSPLDGQLTEFRLPSQYGNVGLLAHNTLSGRLFSRLELGQEVQLLYANGWIETFQIDDIRCCQALQPDSPFTSLCDLDTGETLTAAQLFEKIYMGRRHLTFQTCIAAAGCDTWGRLFVIAARKEPFASPRWN